MSLGKTRWIRDLLILPIIVGVLLVLFQVVVDIYRTKEKVVSIAVEGPFPLVEINELVKKSKIKFMYTYTFPTDEEAEAKEKKANVPSTPNAPAGATGLKVSIAAEIDDPQVYRVIIINNGDLPIKELPISLVFEGASDSFSLLSVEHKTMPPHEFGKIKEDFTFVYYESEIEPDKFSLSVGKAKVSNKSYLFTLLFILLLIFSFSIYFNVDFMYLWSS